MQTSIHHCTGFRVCSHDATNANHISIEVEHSGSLARDPGQRFELTIYDLPVEITDVLKAHFSDENTCDYAKSDLAA